MVLLSGVIGRVRFEPCRADAVRVMFWQLAATLAPVFWRLPPIHGIPEHTTLAAIAGIRDRARRLTPDVAVG